MEQTMNLVDDVEEAQEAQEDIEWHNEQGF